MARTVTSPNGRLQAVITPAPHSNGHATVTLGKTTFTLISEQMPVDVVLFDDGSLLALDEWEHLGDGVIATPSTSTTARPAGAKTLAELLGQAFVDRAPHSVSSIWWRKDTASNGRSQRMARPASSRCSTRINYSSGCATAAPSWSRSRTCPMIRRGSSTALAHPVTHLAALVLLERAIAKDPDLLEAILLYVTTNLQRTQEHARAVAALERFSKRWKSTTTGYGLANIDVAWATSLVALAQIGEAERVLRQGVAAALRPTPIRASPSRSCSRITSGSATPTPCSTTSVVTLFKALTPDTYALNDIAEFYKSRGDLDKALAYCLKVY